MYDTLSTPRNMELASLSGIMIVIGPFHKEVIQMLSLNNHAKSPVLKYHYTCSLTCFLAATIVKSRLMDDN